MKNTGHLQKNAVALIQSCSLFDAVKYCQGCFFDILRMLFVALISGCHCPCIRNNIFSKIMRRFNLFLPFRIIHDHTVTQITACRPYLLCTWDLNNLFVNNDCRFQDGCKLIRNTVLCWQLFFTCCQHTSAYRIKSMPFHMVFPAVTADDLDNGFHLFSNCNNMAHFALMHKQSWKCIDIITDIIFHDVDKIIRLSLQVCQNLSDSKRSKLQVLRIHQSALIINRNLQTSRAHIDNRCTIINQLFKISHPAGHRFQQQKTLLRIVNSLYFQTCTHTDLIHDQFTIAGLNQCTAAEGQITVNPVLFHFSGKALQDITQFPDKIVFNITFCISITSKFDIITNIVNFPNSCFGGDLIDLHTNFSGPHINSGKGFVRHANPPYSTWI